MRFSKITFCRPLFAAILFVTVAACQLPTVEPTLFQPISPLEPTAIAQNLTPPTMLADLQSYRVAWSMQSSNDQFHLNYDWVRADHTWGFDSALQVRMPTVDMIFFEGYLIGDTSYGQMIGQPFEAAPRQDVLDVFPFPTNLILEVEPSEQAVVVPPMFMTQPPFATIVAQTTPVETMEIDGLSVVHYQLSGDQALDLLGAAVQRTGQVYRDVELSAVQGEFWFTADKKHVIRYAIEAEGTSNGGNRPFTLHEAYAVTDINQVPPITLPAEAQAQVAAKAQETAADHLAHPVCRACIFPKPAGVSTGSNHMSGGRFVSFEFPVETDDPAAALTAYEAELVEFGWQIIGREVDEDSKFPHYTWSVVKTVEDNAEAFSVVGYVRPDARETLIFLEIIPQDPQKKVEPMPG